MPFDLHSICETLGAGNSLTVKAAEENHALRDGEFNMGCMPKWITELG